MVKICLSCIMLATIIVFGQGAGATGTTAPNAISMARSANRSPGGSPRVAKFECDVCKLKFASNYNLKRHLRTHDTDRPRWQCSFCDKSFTSKLRHHFISKGFLNLKQTVTTHTGRDSLPKHINFVHKEQASSVKEDEMTITPASPESPPSCDA
jgi:hypothetical protein